MNMNIGKNLNTEEMKNVSGGVMDGVAANDASVMDPQKHQSTKQSLCPFCKTGIPADDATMHPSADGRLFYYGQTCTKCGESWTYGAGF